MKTVIAGVYHKDGKCGYDEKRLMCKCCKCEKRCDKVVLHYVKSIGYNVPGHPPVYTIKCTEINQKRVLKKLLDEGVKIYPIGAI